MSSPLRRRDFRLLWAATLVNDLGDWMLLVGLPVYVYYLTGSALVTSTVLVVELVPTVLVGQFAGVLVDRWDKRRTLLYTGLAQAAALLPLLAVSGRTLWIVYAVAAAQSCLAQLGNPAKAALVPALVPPGELVAANSLTAGAESVARLAGSPLGGVAIDLVGLGGLVLADAASFLLSAALVALIRVAPEPAAARPVATGLVAEWVDGLRVVRRTKPLPALFLITGLAQLAQGVFVVLFVVFVLRVLHGGAADVGLLRGVQAIGGILGGVLLGWLARRLEVRTLVGWGYLAFAAVSLAAWLGPHLTTALGLYVGLFIAVGIPGVAAGAGTMTCVQAVTPLTHLGRVVSVAQAFSGATQAAGLLLAGALADRLGAVPVLVGQAGLYALCGLLGLATLRRPAPDRTGARGPLVEPSLHG